MRAPMIEIDHFRHESQTRPNVTLSKIVRHCPHSTNRFHNSNYVYRPVHTYCPLRYQIPPNNILYNMCIYYIYILNRSGIFACTLRRFTLRRYSAQLCYVWNRVTSNLRNGSSKIRQPREFVGKSYVRTVCVHIQQRKIPRGEEIVS